jgi:hypothetical protein
MKKTQTLHAAMGAAGRSSPGLQKQVLWFLLLLAGLSMTLPLSAQTLPPPYANAVTKFYYIGGRYTYGISQLYDDSLHVGLGTLNPTEKFDVVGGNIRTTGGFISTLADGTPPLQLQSSSLCTNLNSDLLDGMHAGDFAGIAHNHPGMVSGNGLATQVAFWNTAGVLAGNAALFWDNSNYRLGLGTSTPEAQLHLYNEQVPARIKLTSKYSISGLGTFINSWMVSNNNGAFTIELQNGSSTVSGITLNTSTPGIAMNVNGSLTAKRIQLTNGAANNFILSCNSQGMGIWKDPALLTGWTVSGTNVYKNQGCASIGTTNMDARLNVWTQNQPAMIVNNDNPYGGYAILTKSASDQGKMFAVQSNGSERFVVWGNGFMQVDNKIKAKEVEVALDVWHDDVFRPGYSLRPLNELEAYVKINQHLPGIPAETEVLQQGISLGAMNASLLEKIEELTLYIIELNRANASLQAQIDELKNP